MKRLFVMLLCLFSSQVVAEAITPDPLELSLMSGHETSLEYKMGTDLRRLLKLHHIDLQVIPSSGAVENMVKVYEFPSIQLGIVPMDTLTYQSLYPLAQEFGVSAELQNIVSTMQLVLPLYAQTLHLIAPINLKQINDLNGKRIAIGRRSSGTHGSALSLLQLFRIKPDKLLPIDAPQALELMQAGRLDAAFHVAPLPDKQLNLVLQDTDKFHCLPIDLTQVPDQQLFAPLYQTAKISPQHYPWQPDTVSSLSVRTSLITTDTGDCAAVAKLARLVYDNLDWLQQHGHEKWREVTFDKAQLLAHRSLSPCVKTALQAH